MYHSPPDTDDEVDLRLRRDVEVTACASGALEADLLLLLAEVLLHIRLRALEDDLALGLGSLQVRVMSGLISTYKRHRIEESVPKDGMFPATQ